MARIIDVTVDELQDVGLYVTVYPNGTTDRAIDSGTATPENISGHSYQCVIHRSPGDDASLKTYTSPSGGIAFPNGGTDGLMLITIPEADIVTLGNGDFRYYVRRTDSTVNRVVTKGSFVIDAI